MTVRSLQYLCLSTRNLTEGKNQQCYKENKKLVYTLPDKIVVLNLQCMIKHYEVFHILWLSVKLLVTFSNILNDYIKKKRKKKIRCILDRFRILIFYQSFF